jgi:hypothetical protein
VGSERERDTICVYRPSPKDDYDQWRDNVHGEEDMINVTGHCCFVTHIAAFARAQNDVSKL